MFGPHDARSRSHARARRDHQPLGRTRIVPRPTWPPCVWYGARRPAPISIFEETPVVSPEVWQPLQMRRVRYFKKPTTAAPGANGGGGDKPQDNAENPY